MRGSGGWLELTEEEKKQWAGTSFRQIEGSLKRTGIWDEDFFSEIALKSDCGCYVLDINT